MSKPICLGLSALLCILPRFSGTKDYSIIKLNVGYNDIKRLLLHLSRYHSASQLFANINVTAFQAVIRNLIFTFITKLDKLKNVIIQRLAKLGVSELRFNYAIWKHWYKLLYVDQHFDNG